MDKINNLPIIGYTPKKKNPIVVYSGSMSSKNVILEQRGNSYYHASILDEFESEDHFRNYCINLMSEK